MLDIDRLGHRGHNQSGISEAQGLRFSGNMALRP